MAGVLRYDRPQVALESGAAPAFRPPSTEGLDAGRPVQQMGEALSRGASTAADLIVRAQDEANRLRVMEAENAIVTRATELTHGDEGFTKVKGGAVLKLASGKPLADDYGARFGSFVDEVGAGLVNDAQRKMFAERASRLRVAFDEQALKYQAGEIRTHSVSVADGRAKLAGQTLALNPSDPNVVVQALNDIAEARHAKASLLGEASEDADADTRDLQSAALKVAALRMLANGDPVGAKAFRDKYLDKFSADDLVEIEGPIAAENELHRSSGIADGIVDGEINTTPEPSHGTSVPDQGTVIGLPVKGQITGRLGDSRPGNTHNGADIAVPIGTPLKATISGTARLINNDQGGKQVIIVSDDGRYRVGMAHLSAQDVQDGQRVNKGDVIGRSGNSGTSTGPHVHYTVTIDGKKVDPLGEHRVEARKGARPSRDPRGAPKTALEAVERVRDYYDRFHPEASQRERDAAENRATRKFELVEGARAKAKNEAVESALRYIAEHPGTSFNTLPSAIRSEVLRLNPGAADGINTYAANIDAARRGPLSSDPSTYNYLAQHPEQLRTMSEQQFATYLPKLSIEDQRQFARERGQHQAATLGKEAKQIQNSWALPRESVNAVVNKRLSSFGIDPTPTLRQKGRGVSDKDVATSQAQVAQVGTIRQAIDYAVLREQKLLKRQLTDAELEVVVDRLFLRDVKMDRGSKSWRANRMLVKVSEIDAKTRGQIEAALRAMGEPVNEANILRMFAEGY